METTGWLLLIALAQVLHGISTWKLYVKAGRKAWEAFVPVYNGIILMKIINRPKYWILLLFIPVINLFLFPIIWAVKILQKSVNADLKLFGFFILFFMLHMLLAGMTTEVTNLVFLASFLGLTISVIVGESVAHSRAVNHVAN